MKILVLLFFFSLLFSCNSDPLPACIGELNDINYPFIAHSHNDYQQAQPILTALEHGFTSLEVDVAYDGLELRVSHDTDDLDSKPLFADSYLLPLLLATESKESGTLLIVDIKNYTKALLNHLDSIIRIHDDRLLTRDSLNTTDNRIRILLSGEIPREEIINEVGFPYFFIDGREEDIAESPEIVPLISMDISDLTNSNVRDKEKVEALVQQVHDAGKMIRFWKTNDKESVWLTLIDLKVDIIGVDEIENLCGTMKKNGFIN